MALDADRLADRRKLKRSLTFWRVLGVIAVIALAAAVFSPKALPGGVGLKGAGGDYVARYWVTGVITTDPERDELLDELANDPAVKAVIVRIDSPGGTVVGGEELYHQLRNIAEVKPVVAVMGQMGTSGAYMTAIGTDRIFAREGTVTGSIGVILQSADFSGLLDKIGVKAETIRSGALKGEPNPAFPLSEEARKSLEVVVLDMYDLFVDMVAERRPLARDAVLKLADGRIFTGRQAVENGLIDAIGGEAQALDWMVAERGINSGLPVVEVEVDRKLGFLREALEGALGKNVISERLSLDGMIALWHPDSH